MGLAVGPSYTTEYGIVISALYLSIDFMRFMIDTHGNIQCTFTVQGFNSLADKKNGRQSIHLPQNLTVISKSTRATLLNSSSVYEFAYNAVKELWVQTGYEITDVYESGQVVSVPVIEPAVEPTVEPATEPATEPLVEPAAEPASETATEPAVEPASETATEPAVEPAAEPATEPPAEPAAEPSTEPVVEPTTEPVVEPTAEPPTEPATEPAASEPETTTT